MMTPETTIDADCSDPGAEPTSWSEALAVMQSAQMFWITTVRSSGQPHMTPLVAVWSDDALHFCTGENEQKAVNLRMNTKVVLSTGCNTWDSGLDVIVEGDAQRVTDEPTLERLATAWNTKWDGRWNYEPTTNGFVGQGNDLVVVFTVRPKKVLAFAKGNFSATRHLF